jgi:pyruvate carboxylase
MKKLLAANRSEIAVRILRSATELGMQTVAVFAHEDRFGVHRFKADESYLVGRGKGPVAAYLDIEGIIGLAKEKGVDCIHPGYGFLSENPDFARACIEAGITWVGPHPDILEKMGDKVAARKIATEAGVPVLPGTDDPVKEYDLALETGKAIGFPLIIKAAFGGGGRGMRIVRKEEDLQRLLAEAQSEAEQAFGDPSVFLERYIGQAKHIEVQILGDKHGNVVHLFDRDCSVQRRHQKVIEIAPSVNLPAETRAALCDAAVKIAKAVNYESAGTVEFLLDMESGDWFFIEMNPRIQVEHTVTEVVTGIDIVRSMILIAEGHDLHGPEIAIPQQADIICRGYAVQARVTTEDPENNFMPDYGKIVSYRSAAGFGIRLDGAMGDTGSVITAFYDSLLVKLTASAADFETALQRMDRALREMRIRGVKTNIPFLENVIHDPTFRSGKANTTLIDTTPSLFQFKPRRDRATKLLQFLGDVTVNGNEQVKGRKVGNFPLPMIVPDYDHRQTPPDGARQRLLKLGAEKFCAWTREQDAVQITDTTFRDAHQSLLAARMRTIDMLRVAPAMARRTAQLWSMEMWGGATFDTSMRFLKEDPFERLRLLRKQVPNVLFQMLLRGANGVGYSNYPDNVIKGFVRHSADAGIDVFRIFDSLNYLPNLEAAMQAVREETHAICEGTICYTGDIDNPDRAKYSLNYYVSLAQELEKRGAHILAIKDMAGLCKPLAAYRLIRAIREAVGIPVHFHTHDSSGIASATVLKAIEAGADVVDLAISSMSGLTSQPNLNSIVAALAPDTRATGLDLQALNEFSIYWESVRQYYAPFDSGPKFGSAEVYAHEMPGGQYTNLREQAAALGLGDRWPEVVRYYQEVNLLLGDIVKVTPSSKVVGDLAMFLLSRGIEPSDIENLPDDTPFPASVIDMLSGGLGQPMGGFPQIIQQKIVGNREIRTERPGSYAPVVDLEQSRQSLKEKLAVGSVSDDTLWEHLMYPDVHEAFYQHLKSFDNVSVLPTPAFFYGLKIGEEISVEIEEGKTLIIKLITITEPDKNGYRTVTFELNGRAREAEIHDKSIKAESAPRLKANPANPMEIGAPIPGVLSSVNVSVGHKVIKGEKLATLEAMKMQTSLYAHADGTVEAVHIHAGESVEAKDLILKLA